MAKATSADSAFHLALRFAVSDRIVIDKLPNGRIVARAARPAGPIADVFGLLRQEGGPALSIEEMNEMARQGWAGKE